jgi:DNA polymerase-3 subunit gamma/tau
LAEGVEEEGAALRITFGDGAECKMLQEAENLKLLGELAQEFCQRALVISIASSGGETSGAAGDEATPQEERRALANDPLVQMVAEVFGGQVTGVRSGTSRR